MKKLLSLIIFCLALNLGGTKAQCLADYGTISTNLTVQFLDSSTAPQWYNLSYFWNFGDGNSSSLQNPSHTYASAGTYFTCLTIQDTSNNCFDSVCFSITVTAQVIPCNTFFSYSITPNVQTSNVLFTNQSTGVTNTTVFTYDFGDGTRTTFPPNSSTPNAQHNYPVGSYVVTLLQVDSANGTSCSYSDTIVIVNNVPQACMANYTYIVSPTNLVSYFGSATGGTAPYTYSWNFGFGPGSGSTIMNPTYLYATPGSYVTSLTVTDANGITCNYLDTIQINNTCFANFSYQTTGNGVVNFSNLSTPIRSGINFSWNFGDGNFSNTVNPTHSYSTLGNFTVQLVMFDSTTTCTSQIMDTVSITSTSNCQAGFSSTVNNDTLSIQNLASNYTSLVYDFGDGSSSVPGVGNPNHIYTQSGTYIVCQTVVDTLNNCSDTFCDTVSISIPLPCQAGFTFSVNNNVVSILNSAANYNLISYNFGDGSVLGTPNPMYTYAQSGTYIICQTVQNTNTGCSDSFCDTVVIVVPPPCQAGFSFSTNNDTLFIQDQSLNNSAISYSFGDGTFSNSPNPTHVYTQSGTYIVCQTISNTTGCNDTICDTINILISPPCQAGFTYSATLGTITIQNTAQSFTSILYDFGDGSTSTLSNPTHSFANSGKYEVCQTVSNNNSCTSTFCDSVEIKIPPPCQAGFSYVAVGDTIQFTSSASSFNRIIYYFGDGDSSTATNPIHDYQSSGTYQVTQVVFNDTINCIDSITQNISVTVSFSCYAKYQLALDTSRRGILFLINTSSDDGTHDYLWDFGDGSTSTIRLPKHRFDKNRAYKICLTVSDSMQACSSTYCDSVGLDSNGGILKSNGFNLEVIDGGFIGLEEKNGLKDVSVYPNPFTDRITIELNQSQTINYQVIHLNGKVIQEGAFHDSKYELPIKQMESGIYLLRLFNEGGFLMNKMIKQ